MGYCTERASSTIPRLPKLIMQKSLVSKAVEPTNVQDILPGAFLEYGFSPGLPDGRHLRGALGSSLGPRGNPPLNLIANLLSVEDVLQSDLGFSPGDRFRPPRRPCNRAVTRSSANMELGGLPAINNPHVPISQRRRTAIAPIHSRTNLVDTELMDADSDF